MPPSRSSETRAQVRVRVEAVSDRRSADLRQNLADDFVVAAKDGETVERQVVQEFDEALLQFPEIAAVRDEMVVVDVRDDGDDRLQMQEGSVALVCFRDEIAARAELRVAARALQLPADHERRIESAFGEDGGNQARGGGLAVRAGDGDALAEAHELAQHFGPPHDRNPGFHGRDEFRIRVRDRGGDDDDSRACDLFRPRGQ